VSKKKVKKAVRIKHPVPNKPKEREALRRRLQTRITLKRDI